MASKNTRTILEEMDFIRDTLPAPYQKIQRICTDMYLTDRRTGLVSYKQNLIRKEIPELDALMESVHEYVAWETKVKKQIDDLVSAFDEIEAGGTEDES